MLRNYIIGIIVFAVIIFVLSLMSSLSFMQIDTIEITGAKTEIASSTRVLANESLQGKYLGIFSRSNAFLYPKSKIIEEIKKDFPEVKDASIKRNGFSAIHIDVISKIPVSIICSSVPEDFDISQNSHCFYADESGFVFDNIDTHTESIPRIFIQDSTSTNMIGSIPMDEIRYKKLLDFYKKISNAKINVFGILAGENSDELYIGNISKNMNDPKNVVVVYFSERDNLADIFTNLISFWDHMKNDGKVHSFSEIKLQFPPNVYYTETK